MSRIISSSTIFILVILIGWYAGVDYTERGPQQALNLLVAIVCSGAWWFVSAIAADIQRNP